MLKELYIENLAIIEKAVIGFSELLNIFSGETGAGKSILIGGINAILGERVYKDIVRAGADKAVVSALFDAIPTDAAAVAAEYGYPTENNELMLAREISTDGKSVARINGRTATASVMREVASKLIDIHGQHDTQLLMSSDNQRDILDNYGNLGDLLERYGECFKEFQALTRKIKKLEAEDELKNDKILILSERIKEIKALKLIKGEEDEAVNELHALQNSEFIEQTINKIYYSLSGWDDSVGAVDKLSESKSDLESLSQFLPQCTELSERLKSIIIDLVDIKGELGGLINSSNDKARLAYLQERVSEMQRLKRKYGMTIDELITEYEKWQDELAELEFSDDLREKLYNEKKILGDKVKSFGTEITEKRKAASEKLTNEIMKVLVYLDMPNIILLFDIKQDKVTVKGMDSVRMLISVNKGEEPKPIEKIASGGELSRIMLAIKSVLADCDNIPTMIFDEIDTGISGRAAHKVGVKLREISRKRQVLCVTHLAQIAAMADRHLMIEKNSDESRTFTKVYELDDEGRKRELARIISGDSDSEISLKNAEELINTARQL